MGHPPERVLASEPVKPFALDRPVDRQLQHEQPTEMRLALDQVRHKAVRHGRGDTVGQGQNAMVHLLHDQAVQVQKISSNAQLGDGARAVLKSFDTGGEPRNEQTAV